MNDTAYGRNAVAPLIGDLPAHCSQDIDFLKSFVQSHLQVQTPVAATASDEFKEVFLTGANGFVGRYFLSELLKKNSRLTVHCLVRGKCDKDSENRLRSALELSGLWDSNNRKRIRIVCGDIGNEYFGLDAERFADLCHRVDAIYHLAANLALARPYLELRRSNTFGVRNVLELGLTTRFKHVFFASTMGVFPEYFCGFAQEFATSRILDESQPDTEMMKRHLPLGVIGYPWSKLVVEQALLYAHSTGMPLAIFRLPLTGVASDGFTQPNDIGVRVLSAVNDVEMAPPGISIQNLCEPVDILADVCTTISTNPLRRHTIYHCCDSQPQRNDVTPADMGIDLKKASYREFKRACLARSEKSPLHGYWLLLDQFAPYWFKDVEPNETVRIENQAIRNDCPFRIKWSSPLSTLIHSWRWMARTENRWPYPQPKFRISDEHLVDEAKSKFDLMETDFDDAFPHWMLEGLRQYVKSLDLQKTKLRSPSLGLAALGISRNLRENIMLSQERQLHPVINEQQIKRPVFILGINRTGTTFLHRLLSRDSRFWTLRMYELFESVIPDGSYAQVADTKHDPRRETANLYLEISELREIMTGIHQIEVNEPEEDIALLDLSFHSWALGVSYCIPEYLAWLRNTDFENAYRYHRTVLQHFHWRRRLVQPDEPERQWLLKMPFHINELDSLTKAYPDALFIQTHREPADFLASWISLVERLRKRNHTLQPLEELGSEQLAFMSESMNRIVDFRCRHPELADRWADIKFSELTRNPMDSVSRIYGQFNWPLTSCTSDVLDQWRISQAEKHQQEVRHEYRLSDYGLTPETVNDAFRDYIDFVERLNF